MGAKKISCIHIFAPIFSPFSFRMLELAIAGGVEHLVTHNTRDFGRGEGRLFERRSQGLAGARPSRRMKNFVLHPDAEPWPFFIDLRICLGQTEPAYDRRNSIG
jgi:hypothetical protein